MNRSQLRYGATTFAIVLAMNRGIDGWVSFPFTHPSLLHLKANFMKKNRSFRCDVKKVPLTYVSFGLL